jgi:hypothetical protein
VTKLQADKPFPGPDAAPRVPEHEKEALISLIAILYIDQNGLLNRKQLESARQGFDALFVETSGEETILRKLIDTLAAQCAVDHAFGDLSGILSGIDRGFQTAQEKINSLKDGLKRQAISAEEHAEFVGPFLSFSHDFSDKLEHFRRLITEYLRAREQEARAAYIFDIARRSRERLKHRFEKGLRGSTGSKRELTRQVEKTFDFAEAETDYGIASREATRVHEEIEAVLAEFREMCQYAMKPEHRDPMIVGRLFYTPPCADIFTLYTEARKEYPDLARMESEVLELFRLFQHAYGICRLDFDHFQRAVSGIREHTEIYFRAKQEDQDVQATRDKLQRIEALISFLEYTIRFVSNHADDTYVTFSRKLSDTIMRPDSEWSAIADELLHMKVTAEAEMSTRLA